MEIEIKLGRFLMDFIIFVIFLLFDVFDFNR
jgi:hypothetical protein